MRFLLAEFLTRYDTARPHQGVGNELLTTPEKLSEEIASLGASQVLCRERLGGLLKHYERRAA